MPTNASAVGTAMFPTVAFSTGEKPQSKIWYHDGSYWAIVQGPDGVAFYEKVGNNWVRGTFTNAVLASTGQADVKWNGTDLFVLNYTFASTVQLFKYNYVSATRTWSRLTGFPVNLPNPGGSETMVLDQDSSGRLWTTTMSNGSVNAYYSTSADHRTWSSSPVVLRTGANADDISTVIAFGGNKIGVFWSDQNRWEFGFRIHQDADAPTTWGAQEIAFAGTDLTDDHVNLATDSQGRVYAITKDAFNEMRVHRRATNGSWTTKSNVLNGHGTRGIVQISEADSRVYILYTRWDVVPERIEVRWADINTLTFGNEAIFISSSGDMNNVSGMKQPLQPGSLVAIAEDADQCWYNSLGGSSPPPPAPPTNLSATLATGPVRTNLTWSAPSGTVDGYNVYRQASGGSFVKLNGSLVTTTSYTDSSLPLEPLCYHVRTVRSNLESTPSSSACVDNTPPVPPAPPTNLSATLLTGPARTNLTWSAPSGTLDGYNVYRQASGGSFVKLNGSLVTATSYTDTSLPLEPLCYHVRTVRSNLESTPSSSACVDNTPLPPPGAPQVLAVSLAEVPPQPALLQLNFEEGSGQVAGDASGNANHARLGSSTGSDSADPLWVSGKAGSALQFDGSNDYLLIADAPSLDPTGSFTIESWVRHDTGAGIGTLVNKGASSARTYRVRILDAGDVEFFWETSNGTDREAIAPGVILDSNWHHVACVYDQAAGENRVYVDGVERAAATASGVPVTSTAVLHIGARISSSSLRDFLDGALDGLRIVPVALYNANFVPPAAPPLANTTTQNATLAWQAPQSGAPAATYEVFRSTGGGSFASLGTTPLATWIDAAVPVGNQCYRVTAINSQGLAGVASDIACVEVLPPLLAAPQSFAADLVLISGGPPAGVAAYGFDEATGQTFADATGNGLTGTRGATAASEFSDPTWTAGIDGSCLRFDGIDDRAIVPDAPALRPTGSFTLEAWIATDAETASECIVAKGLEGALNYALGLDAAGQVQLRWNDTVAGAHQVTTTASPNVKDGSWHHIAAVYDSAATECRLYVDGALAAATPAVGTPVTSAAGLRLGCVQVVGGNSAYFRGSIDLVRVASSVLYDAPFVPRSTLDPPGSTRVHVAWSAVAHAVDYRLYRQEQGGTWELLHTAASSATDFDDLSPASGPACYRIAARDDLGREGAASAVACVTPASTDTQAFAPVRTLGLAVYPNPLRGRAQFSFELPASSHLRLEVFDVRGRRVVTLVDAAQTAGRHVAVWDGHDSRGQRVPAGVYFTILEAAGTRLHQKLIVVR